MILWDSRRLNPSTATSPDCLCSFAPPKYSVMFLGTTVVHLLWYWKSFGRDFGRCPGLTFDCSSQSSMTWKTSFATGSADPVGSFGTSGRKSRLKLTRRQSALYLVMMSEVVGERRRGAGERGGGRVLRDGHQWQSGGYARASSEVISGNQRSSEVISGSPAAMLERHQWSSEVISGNQRSSVAIRGHQRSSEVISGHPIPSVAIRGHQQQTDTMSGNQRSSVAISLSTCLRAQRQGLSGNRLTQ